MAIKNSHSHVLHNGFSRRVRSASFGILIGSLAWVAMAGSAWASDSSSSLKDPQLQTIAALQSVDSAPITSSESAASPNAVWQIEIAYAVSETSSGVSVE